MSKKLDKLRGKISEALTTVEDENVLNAFLTFAENASGATGEVDTSEGEEDGGKKKKKKDKGGDDDKPAGNAALLDGIKPKKLKAIAAAAGENVDDADNDSILEALNGLSEKKLRKAAAAAEVELAA